MQYLKSNSILLVLAVLLTNSPLLAHEGHGSYEHSVLHYFYSADHLILIALAAVVVLLLIKVYKKVKI
jgi:hydrogenase/urease accessory protein HupE